MLEIIGLILIIIAWIVQIQYSWQGKKNIQNSFMILYALGVILLVYDSYKSNIRLAILNLISLLAVLFLLIKLNFKRRKGYVNVN